MRPDLEQIQWVVHKLYLHALDGGSFSDLLKKLELDTVPGANSKLYAVGARTLHDLICGRADEDADVDDEYLPSRADKNGD